jgi:hypothetical protein
MHEDGRRSCAVESRYDFRGDIRTFSDSSDNNASRSIEDRAFFATSMIRSLMFKTLAIGLFVTVSEFSILDFEGNSFLQSTCKHNKQLCRLNAKLRLFPCSHNIILRTKHLTQTPIKA